MEQKPDRRIMPKQTDAYLDQISKQSERAPRDIEERIRAEARKARLAAAKEGLDRLKKLINSRDKNNEPQIAELIKNIKLHIMAANSHRGDDDHHEDLHVDEHHGHGEPNADEMYDRLVTHYREASKNNLSRRLRAVINQRHGLI